MNSKSDDPRVLLLFPSCDRDGVLLDAIGRADDEPVTRADALLFGWMLGLDAAVDAVGAARAVLAVATQRGAGRDDSRESPCRRALIDGLERFVADRGRVASLSTASISGGIRPRRRLRDRTIYGSRSVVTQASDRCEGREEGDARPKAVPNGVLPRD